MSQEADDSSCREECAADKGWAHEAAASDQGDQDGHYWATVSPRRRRQASTQEEAQDTLGEEETSLDHWAGPGLPLGYARKGRICDHTECQEIIDDHTYRLYPTYCSKCLEVWTKVNERFRFSKYSHV